MDINLPVWGYYPRDDQTFIDPLYAPYVRDIVETPDGQFCGVNTTAKQGYADGFVHPGLVRNGWGLGFQLMHPDTACPSGWTKGEGNGWCEPNQPEFGDNGLYTDDAFIPKYQYWGSYAPRLQNSLYKEINEFDRKSVSPWSGDYVINQIPKPSSNRAKYGHLPSKDSYLA